MRRVVTGIVCLSLSLSLAAPAFAQYGMDRKGPKNAATPELPHCDRPLGRAAIQEPESRWVGGAGPVQSGSPAQAVRRALRLPAHRRPQRRPRHAQPGGRG